jgi:hypothetical protein
MNEKFSTQLTLTKRFTSGDAPFFERYGSVTNRSLPELVHDERIVTEHQNTEELHLS